MSGLLVLLPQAPAFVPLLRPTNLLHRSAPRCSSSSADALDFSVRLVKPMGLRLEEEQAGSAGLRVGAVLRGGSAAASGIVWPGDLLLGVGMSDVAGATFEEAMGVIASAGGAVELRFSRDPSRAVAVRFPGDRLAFGAPGDTLEALALSAGYLEIHYGCRAGHCGTCEVVMRTGGRVRTLRACSSRLPRCTTLEPHQVLSAKEVGEAPPPADVLKLQEQLLAELSAERDQKSQMRWPW